MIVGSFWMPEDRIAGQKEEKKCCYRLLDPKLA
uniref:Uncharacterized protein n=1 Tax=Arundo donax TaxID=35708 RepID=A0A0A9A9M1_ARUDO